MEGHDGAQKERSFEIGKDEAWAANMKRMFDEYMEIGLEGCKRNARYSEKVLSDAQNQTVHLNQLSVQALQNAVETANLVSKQAVAHRDIAIDRQWNVDEVSTLTAKSGIEADAIIAILAAAVADALNKKDE